MKLIIDGFHNLTNTECKEVKNQIEAGLEFEENCAGTKDATIKVGTKEIDLELIGKTISVTNAYDTY